MLKINIHKLNQHIENNLIFRNKHPEYDLWIYNYTKHCVYERLWDELTLMCRGLILDKDYNIIARPFPKFFNYEELDKNIVDYYMKQDFYTYEKKDGCLGILYFYNNLPYIASRGSFNSIYSDAANEILHNKYEKYLYRLDKSYTHVFEIIHPKTRILVDYKGKEELVLLGVLSNTENKEVDLNSVYCESLGFPIVESFNIKSYSEMKKLNIENKEGFVLRFPIDNYRMKIKFENYIEKHSLLFNVNNKIIYNILREWGDLDKMISELPDEMHDWCNMIYFDFLKKFYNLKRVVKSYVEDIKKEFTLNEIEFNNKNLALYLKDSKILNVYYKFIFKEWEKKDYDKLLWDELKPEFLPFAHSISN